MSDQYVNMCRQATEIQKAWKPKEGDVQCTGPTGRSIVPRRITSDIKKYYCWLPRIEDLIEMVKDGTLGTDAEAEVLAGVEFYVKRESPYPQDTISITFLKFTMHKLYNKSWNGEAWI